MNSIVASVIQSGGTALVVLHELAPAGAMLARTLTLADGRIEAPHAERPGRVQAAPMPATR
jgi:ABC-type hemin transport system ATPase subunit